MKGGGKRPSPFQHVSWPVEAKSLLPTQPAWGPSHGMLPRTQACKGCTISEIKMEQLWKWRLIPLLKKPKSKAHLCLISSYKTIKRRHRWIVAVNGPQENRSMGLCWGGSRLGGFRYDTSGSLAVNSNADIEVGREGMQEGRALVRTSVITQ